MQSMCTQPVLLHALCHLACGVSDCVRSEACMAQRCHTEGIKGTSIVVGRLQTSGSLHLNMQVDDGWKMHAYCMGSTVLC